MEPCCLQVCPPLGNQEALAGWHWHWILHSPPFVHPSSQPQQCANLHCSHKWVWAPGHTKPLAPLGRLVFIHIWHLLQVQNGLRPFNEVALVPHWSPDWPEGCTSAINLQDVKHCGSLVVPQETKLFKV